MTSHLRARAQVVPWPQINDYLLEIAAARDVNQLLRLALQKMDDLIPLDQARILGFVDVPDQVVYLETRGGSEACNRAFQQYYRRIMPDIGMTVLKWGVTDWYQYDRTEYVTDFIRPNGIRYTAGISRFGSGSGNLSISMNRSPAMSPFDDAELAILAIIQEHLANYCAMLSLVNPDRIYPDASDIQSLCRVLTRREAEIAALLCRKYSAEIIASRLLISPLTVYKHIENIYAKLKVNCRKDLRLKLLGPNPNDENGEGQRSGPGAVLS